MSFGVFIPPSCDRCNFFNQTEDGENWCSLYQKDWEMDDEETDDFGVKPDFCKASSVTVEEA